MRAGGPRGSGLAAASAGVLAVAGGPALAYHDAPHGASTGPGGSIGGLLEIVLPVVVVVVLGIVGLGLWERKTRRGKPKRRRGRRRR